MVNNTANGLLTGTTLGVVTDSYSYIESGQSSGFGELLDYQADSGGTPVFKTVFERDDLGRITKKTETVNGSTTVFDYTYTYLDQQQVARDAGRLEKVVITPPVGPTKERVFTYGDNSNRETVHEDGALILDAEYDDQDRLTKLTPQSGVEWTYKYTANGELKEKFETLDETNTKTSYEYDVLGNLLKVILDDGTVIDYIIDGRNRRVGKKIGGTMQKQWLYKDQLNPIAELDQNGNITKRKGVIKGSVIKV